jgi:predicted RNA methylase
MDAQTFGIPIAYQQGWVEYRGRRFFVDERVFITDSETSHMLDAVIQQLRSSEGVDKAYVAELGTGCGAIGISLLKEMPNIRLIGLEIDPQAIEVAKRNASAHRVNFELLESDFFSAWGNRPQPNVIFGDLPWGDDNSVYSPDRPIEHYLAMPRHSVFPVGGPMGMHRKALETVKQLGWSSHVFLNCGMLAIDAVLDMSRDSGAVHSSIIRAAENVSVLHCQMN